MVVINTEKKKVYKCSMKEACKIMGISPRTLRRWKNEQHKTSIRRGNYVAMFDLVEIKQKKGFGLKPKLAN